MFIIQGKKIKVTEMHALQLIVIFEILKTLSYIKAKDNFLQNLYQLVHSQDFF